MENLVAEQTIQETTFEILEELEVKELTEEPKPGDSEEVSLRLMEKANKTLLLANKGIKRCIIYADPPWKYQTPRATPKSFGRASEHYETISLECLKLLKVKEITAKDCILFLWTTAPKMKEALELLDAWGFRFITIFMNWVKTRDGEVKGPRLGYYTRQVVEYVLMGVRGGALKFRVPNQKCVFNVYQEDSREHSRKPKYVKDTIDKLFYNVPKIELFARESTDLNWDFWGNEREKFGTNSNSSDMIRSEQINLAKKLMSNGDEKQRDEIVKSIDEVVNTNMPLNVKTNEKEVVVPQSPLPLFEFEKQENGEQNPRRKKSKRMMKLFVWIFQKSLHCPSFPIPLLNKSIFQYLQNYCLVSKQYRVRN